jgi:hypothetical protein
VLAVARVWYVNAVYKLGTGGLVSYGVSFLGGGESGVINALMEEFDKYHESNLKNAFSTDQIDGYIDQFMSMLDERGI